MPPLCSDSTDFVAHRKSPSRQIGLPDFAMMHNHASFDAIGRVHAAEFGGTYRLPAIGSDYANIDAVTLLCPMSQ
jgi:hypothetical protein